MASTVDYGGAPFLSTLLGTVGFPSTTSPSSSSAPQERTRSSSSASGGTKSVANPQRQQITSFLDDRTNQQGSSQKKDGRATAAVYAPFSAAKGAPNAWTDETYSPRPEEYQTHGEDTTSTNDNEEDVYKRRYTSVESEDEKEELFIEEQLKRQRESTKRVRWMDGIANLPSAEAAAELERRFNEQLDVHRGLNAALTQLDTIEKDVKRQQSVAAAWASIPDGVQVGSAQQPVSVVQQSAQQQPAVAVGSTAVPPNAIPVKQPVTTTSTGTAPASTTVNKAKAAQPASSKSVGVAPKKKGGKKMPAGKKNAAATKKVPASNVAIVRPDPKPTPYFRKMKQPPRIVYEGEEDGHPREEDGDHHHNVSLPHRSVSVAESPSAFYAARHNIEYDDDDARSSAIRTSSRLSHNRSGSIATDYSHDFYPQSQSNMGSPGVRDSIVVTTPNAIGGVRDSVSSLPGRQDTTASMHSNSNVRIRYVPSHHQSMDYSEGSGFLNRRGSLSRGDSIVTDTITLSASQAGSMISTESYTGSSYDSRFSNNSYDSRRREGGHHRGGGHRPPAKALYGQFQTLCKRAADLLDIRTTLRTARKQRNIEKHGKVLMDIRDTTPVEEDGDTKRLKELVKKMERDLHKLEQRRLNAVNKRILAKKAKKLAAARERMKDGRTALSEVVEEDDFLNESRRGPGGGGGHHKRRGSDSISDDFEFEGAQDSDEIGDDIVDDFDDFGDSIEGARRGLFVDDDEFGSMAGSDFEDSFFDDDSLQDELEDIDLEVQDEDLEFMSGMIHEADDHIHHDGSDSGESHFGHSDEELDGGLRFGRRKVRNVDTNRGARNNDSNYDSQQKRRYSDDSRSAVSSSIISSVEDDFDEDWGDQPGQIRRRRRGYDSDDSRDSRKGGQRRRRGSGDSNISSSIADSFASLPRRSGSSSSSYYRDDRRRGAAPVSDASTISTDRSVVVVDPAAKKKKVLKEDGSIIGSAISEDKSLEGRRSRSSDETDSYISSGDAADVDSGGPRSTTHESSSYYTSDERRALFQEDDSEEEMESCRAAQRRAEIEQSKKRREALQSLRVPTFTSLWGTSEPTNDRYGKHHYDPCDTSPSVSGDSHADLFRVRDDDVGAAEGFAQFEQALAARRATINKHNAAMFPTKSSVSARSSWSMKMEEEDRRILDCEIDEQLTPANVMKVKAPPKIYSDDEFSSDPDVTQPDEETPAMSPVKGPAADPLARQETARYSSATSTGASGTDQMYDQRRNVTAASGDFLRLSAGSATAVRGHPDSRDFFVAGASNKMSLAHFAHDNHDTVVTGEFPGDSQHPTPKKATTEKSYQPPNRSFAVEDPVAVEHWKALQRRTIAVLNDRTIVDQPEEGTEDVCHQGGVNSHFPQQEGPASPEAATTTHPEGRNPSTQEDEGSSSARPEGNVAMDDVLDAAATATSYWATLDVLLQRFAPKPSSMNHHHDRAGGVGDIVSDDLSYVDSSTASYSTDSETDPDEEGGATKQRRGNDCGGSSSHSGDYTSPPPARAVLFGDAPV